MKYLELLKNLVQNQAKYRSNIHTSNAKLGQPRAQSDPLNQVPVLSSKKRIAFAFFAFYVLFAESFTPGAILNGSVVKYRGRKKAKGQMNHVGFTCIV